MNKIKSAKGDEQEDKKMTMSLALEQRNTQSDIGSRVLWQKEFGLNAAYLTPKEIEILHFMAQGYLNKQIANNLDIAEQTAKNHVSSILRKLDASNRTQAVMRASRFGIISLLA